MIKDIGLWYGIFFFFNYEKKNTYFWIFFYIFHKKLF